MSADKFRIALCEDNIDQLSLLKDVVCEYINEKMLSCSVDVFSSGEELMRSVSARGAYDIYILDMILGGITGMDVAKKLRNNDDDGKIIFLTSSLEYAVSSYDVRAYYYLVKPLDTQKLYSVFDRAFDEIDGDDPSVLVKTQKGDVLLKTSDILYVDLQNRCLNYHMKDGRICVGKTLRSSFKNAMEKIVKKENFSFCGVSTVVNMNYISTIDTQRVIFKEGSYIFPSRAGITEVKNSIKKYISTE